MKQWELTPSTSRATDKFYRKLNSKAKSLRKKQLEHLNNKDYTKGYNRYTNTMKIVAPEAICIYKKKYCDETLTYISDIRSAFTDGKNIHLTFPVTNYVSAAAMLLLLSTVDQLNRTVKVKITATRAEDDKTECIFNQTGFTKILGKNAINTNTYKDVDYWQQTTAKDARPENAAEIFEVLQDNILINEKLLFRGFIESISNSVEHGYKHLNSSHLSRHSRWWAFGGINNGVLTLLTCDLGAGIPLTLPRVIDEKWLARTLKFCGFETNQDAELIQAATVLRETATKEEHRGKGLNDMKKIVEQTPGSTLIIHSNRGSYLYHVNKNGETVSKLKGYKSSINGTIIEWQMPLGVK
ncbi:MAG: hypothetical protein COA74_09505 [Gammaproteobacteria bacterium]|nr:MAG: hypothetical protein COA74_09505 [Gammaproteobacteria bacterium]